MKPLYLSLSPPHHTYITYNILTYLTEVMNFWKDFDISHDISLTREIQREWF